MPDWLSVTLQTLPSLLWIILGLGVPWALVVLPRRDWRDKAMIACLALAFGPALLTGWMFVLGTLGQDHTPGASDTINPMQTTIANHVGGQALLRVELILGGTVILAFLGLILLAIKARRVPAPPSTPALPLANDERVLIAFIVVATLVRWFITSWLPFGSWDPMWVYGYQGKIYTLLGYIPSDIGYYPQFLSLQYAYGQIVGMGEISDHAARAVLPFLQVGSILATYLMGSRLFNRRTGIFAAAMWTLYAHFGYWTRIGDLEIPVTFGFTGAAAFFLMAWVEKDRFLRRRYALIAGLFLGVAMWTKPTAGAFVWGVVLLLLAEFIRVRGAVRDWLPRFEVAFMAGIASIPLGALWYVRNILLGHDAIVLPPSVWLTRALRSGGEFGWPLLALSLLLLYVHFGPLPFRPNKRLIRVGVFLIVLGAVPTILLPARMDMLDSLLFAAGVIMLAAALADMFLSYYSHFSDYTLAGMSKIAWAALLALPYFVTWFYSYSYHYRLSFTIVPLMILPIAALLAHWFTPECVQCWRRSLRLAYAFVIVIIGLQGVAIAVYDEGLGWDWLWTIPPEGDYSQAGLLGVVDTLQAYVDETGEQPVVVAPGLQPLPFFFPEADIRVVQTPRRIAQLEGVTHFIGGRIAIEWYVQSGGVSPLENQWYASLARENVVTEIASFADEAFSYNVFRVHANDRFLPVEVAVPVEQEVIFGDFARFVGYTVTTRRLDGGFIIDVVWQALDSAPDDYTIYRHLILLDDPDHAYLAWDGPPVPTDYGHYSTRFWEAGEYIIDRRILLPYELDIPATDQYRLRMGFYDFETHERVPVTVDGQPNGDGYILPRRFLYQVEG